jgi:hypothetical protein
MITDTQAGVEGNYSITGVYGPHAAGIHWYYRYQYGWPG